MNTFNDIPDGITQITVGTFMNLLTKRKIMNTELRQPKKWLKKPYGTIDYHLYYFADNTGIAVAPKYEKGKVDYLYFKFGCSHEYIQQSQESCLKTHKCNVCNHIYIVDSSD